MFDGIFLFLGALLSNADVRAEEKFTKRIVSSHVSGNVLAQFGKYVGFREMENRKKKVLSYKWR
ncbi:MAG: hypothetical protein FWF51_07605 [Chitinivibrionia bacterium]|jgi:hypothetical protein|nr:hypothetical protein [Chitinivibrionia bacterium]